MISRNDPCWCASGKKWKFCHYPHKSSKQDLKEEYLKKYDIRLKSSEEIKKIKKACSVTAIILNELCKAAKEGVTTNELDLLSRKLHKEFNAIPAPYHYGSPPFPKTICTSLNEVICHGIPNDEPLKKSDILNIDVSCIVDGVYGDCSRMVMIPPVDQQDALLCEVALSCLNQSISMLRPELPLYAIGDVIEEIARKHGFSVVHQFVGHGVGLDFHEEPLILHHKNKINTPLAEGMIFTIEPMINAGEAEGRIDKKNQWEARTIDNKKSAQWEHTILITEIGYEILTLLNE